MKLEEIKSSLIQNFFGNQSPGVHQTLIDPIFTQLANAINESVLDSVIEETEGSSADATKAFKKFTDGRRSTLSICENDGMNVNIIFAAIRSGKQIVYEDLTVEQRTIKFGDLASIKTALKQAKNLNDEAYFIITNEK